MKPQIMKTFKSLFLGAALVFALSIPLRAQPVPPAIIGSTLGTGPILPAGSGSTLGTIPGIPAIPAVPTAPPPATPQDFITSVQGFLTSFTDLQTFTTNDTFDLWTGAEYINNAHTAVCLGLSYNTAWRPIGLIFGVESVTRNQPGLVGTAILSENVGVNLQLVHKDVKIVVYVDPGYDFNLSKPDLIIGARIFKALTDNTFTGLGLAEPIGSGKLSSFPTVSVFAGVKF